jgi:tetratricopeptide (TPR) repeat protein
MRKAMIATEAGSPAQGLGIADAALKRKEALTPRLRAVILRQRSYSNAALGEVIATAKDADEAVTEAAAGENQGEEDRAPYCTPTYAAMEAGASWVLLGHPKTAIPILEKSCSEWVDHTEVRDYALCVSRLALAYAAAGDVERACAAADEVLALTQGLGSRRVVSQLGLLYRGLEKWRRDPAVARMRGRLKMLADSFKPGQEAS